MVETEFVERHQAAYAWLQSGRAARLSSSVSDAFDVYVSALPWAGTTGLDWARMPSSRALNLGGRAPAAVYEWVKDTRLGGHDHVAIWYSRTEGGIVVPLREAITALDELYRDAPGTRFAFGMGTTAGAVQPTFTDLLQYGQGDQLVATV